MGDPEWGSLYVEADGEEGSDRSQGRYAGREERRYDSRMRRVKAVKH